MTAELTYLLACCSELAIHSIKLRSQPRNAAIAFAQLRLELLLCLLLILGLLVKRLVQLLLHGLQTLGYLLLAVLQARELAIAVRNLPGKRGVLHRKIFKSGFLLPVAIPKACDCNQEQSIEEKHKYRTARSRFW